MPRYEVTGYRVEHYRMEGEYPDAVAANESFRGGVGFPGWYPEHEHTEILAVRELEPDCS